MKKKLISLLLSIAMLASLALPAMAEESTGTALDGYTDVDGTAWYAEAVTYVIENGIMGSTSTDAKLFAPDGTVTRATVYQTLYNMEGRPAVEEGASFADGWHLVRRLRRLGGGHRPDHWRRHRRLCR